MPAACASSITRSGRASVAMSISDTGASKQRIAHTAADKQRLRPVHRSAPCTDLLRGRVRVSQGSSVKSGSFAHPRGQSRAECGRLRPRCNRGQRAPCNNSAAAPPAARFNDVVRRVAAHDRKRNRKHLIHFTGFRAPAENSASRIARPRVSRKTTSPFHGSADDPRSPRADRRQTDLFLGLAQSGGGDIGIALGPACHREKRSGQDGVSAPRTVSSK